MADKRVYKKLPEIFQTEPLDKFFKSTIDQWFTSEQVIKTSGYIGRKDPTNYNPKTDFYLPEIDNTRKNYQLEPALITKDADSADINSALFYDDAIKTLSVDGSNVDNHHRLFKSKAYSWAPPIDMDKFINYENYYWYEPAEVITFDITAGSTPLNITTDIIGKKTFTSYNEVEFTNGLKVRFTGSNIAPQGYINKVWIVEGVGTSIHLLDLESVLLNDTRAYTTTTIADKIDYVTIKRGANNANPWSRLNGWYHKDVLLRGTGTSTGTTYSSVTDKPWDKLGDFWDEEVWDQEDVQRSSVFSLDSSRKALRPIIEFDNDLELFNYGLESAGTVSFAAGQTFDLVHNATNPTIDGVAVQTDDTVIFLNSGNLLNFILWDGEKIINTSSGETEGVWDSTAWDIESTSAGNNLGKIYKATITSGVCTLTEIKTILTDQKLLILKGDDLSGCEYHWSGSDWVKSQGKTSQNDEPLFQLYDDNKVKLDHIGTYPSSTFEGNKLFSYKTSTGTSDAIIGKPLEYKEFGQIADIVFENNYEDAITYADGTILGYKYHSYYNLNAEIGDVVFVDTVDLVEGTRTFNDIHGKLDSQVGSIDDQASLAGKKLIFFNNTENYTDAFWDIEDWDDDTPAESWAQQTNLPFDPLQTGIYTISIENVPGTSENRVMLTLTTTINHGDYVTITDGVLYSNKDYTWQSDGWTEVKFKIPPATRQISFYNNSWNETNAFNKQRVVERYLPEVDGTQEYILNTTPITNSPADVIVTVDGKLAKQSTASTPYDYNVVDNKLTFTTNKILSKDQLIEVKSFTKDPVNLNDNHYFEIPDSLEANPNNKDLTSASASELLDHFMSIIDNQDNLTGVSNGVNNYRDTAQERSKGLKILQHESSMLPLMNMLSKNNTFRVLDVIRYNQREYVNFKNKFLQRAQALVLTTLTEPIDVFVDAILEDMFTKRSNLVTFKDTKGLAFGTNFVKTSLTMEFNADYIDLSERVLATSLNDRSKIVYIYWKGFDKSQFELLTNVRDYKLVDHVNSAGDTITRIQFPNGIKKDDKIEVRIYTDIQNSFMPPTPSMLGLHQVYRPGIEADATYLTGSKDFIVGHDGSRTLKYNDYRDRALLELEKRIYNAIPDKFVAPDYIPEVNGHDFIPGKFRDNDYTLYEFNRILEPIYQRWSVENKVDTLTHRDYDQSLAFSWNYGKEPDRDGETVPGAWRGVYLYFYDTHRPHTHPWEMLSFSMKPSWWDSEYGPVASNNISLWSDLEQGIIRKGARENFTDNSYLTNNPYRRIGLSNFIPVDISGNLRDPVQAGIFGDGLISGANYSKPHGPDRDDPWQFGDNGPAEFSMRLNSIWPFVLNKLNFLTRPAEWTSKNWDTLNLSRAKANTSQIIFDDVKKRKDVASFRYHNVNLTDASTTPEYVFGHQQWFYNYLLNKGINYEKFLAKDMKTADVNLGYKVGGFVSNNNITIEADTYSTTRTTDNIHIPIENKSVKIYGGASEGIRSYSGVIVEITDTGYKVYGYDPYHPAFRIIPSEVNGPSKAIDVEDFRVYEYQSHYDVVAEVEYGTEFESIPEVFDFLISYERYLKAIGFIFDEFDIEAEDINDFQYSGKQFVYWARLTSWDTGAFITLSPVANKIKLDSTNLGRISSIDEIINGTYAVLDKNGVAIPSTDLSIKRSSDNFIVESISGTGIYGFKVNTFKSEHAMFFDNKTNFNDLIYDPVLRLRQHRLRLNIAKTGTWNGQVEGDGYIIANDTILPNFDTVANDYRKFFDNKNAPIAKPQRDSARHVIGYQHRDYLTNITKDDDIAYEFYKGFLRQKGTQESIKRLTRSKHVSEDDELSFHEEFALKIGDFGATRITTDNEIQIKSNDVKVQNPLIEFTYETASVDATDDDVIQINHSNDPRWLRKPKTELTTVWPKHALSDEAETLPTSGYIHNDDVTFRAYDLKTLAGLNTVDKLAAEPTIKGIAHVAKSQNGNPQVYKLVDSGLRPHSIKPVDGSTTKAEINITGQTIPTITGTQSTATSSIGDTIAFEFDNDVGTLVTVTLSTADTTATRPVMNLEVKTDVTSLELNDSIYINTTLLGAGTEIIFNNPPTDRPVVVLGTVVNPSRHATLRQFIINDETVNLTTGDTLENIITDVNASTTGIVASVHNRQLRIQKTAGGSMILSDVAGHEGTLRFLGLEEGTYHNDFTIKEVQAAIIAAEVPNLNVTKISDSKIKLTTTTSVIITTEGIGNAYDRLLFTNAVNNSEVNKIDTSRVTIDTIITDIKAGFTKEDFLVSKTAGGLLQFTYNSTALTISGTGLAGVGMSAITKTLASSAITQHNFTNGDVIVLQNVNDEEGATLNIDGGYEIETKSSIHSYTIEIVNGIATVTNDITNTVEGEFTDVNSIPIYDIVSADRDCIKNIAVEVKTALSPIEFELGDTLDDDRLIISTVGFVDRYFGTEKLYTAQSGNIVFSTASGKLFTSGKATVSFTIEKKGIIVVEVDKISKEGNSASNILWWRSRKYDTKVNVYNDVLANAEFYDLNDLVWVDNKPNGWIVGQYVDQATHWGLQSVIIAEGGDNYEPDDIGTLLTVPADSTHTKTSPVIRIDNIAYKVSGVTLDSPGSGYTSPPSVTFSGGGTDTQATAEAVLSSAISAVNISFAGGGYKEIPGVNISESAIYNGSTWIINHNLNQRLVNLDAKLFSGSYNAPTINYVSNNQVVVDWHGQVREGIVDVVKSKYTSTLQTGNIWNINHALNQTWVNVDIINAGFTSAIGSYDHPTIEYTDANNCKVIWPDGVSPSGYVAIGYNKGNSSTSSGHVHTQGANLNEWTVTHNMGKKHVNVDIALLGSELVDADYTASIDSALYYNIKGLYNFPTVTYVNANSLKITWPEGRAPAGKVIISAGEGSTDSTGATATVHMQVTNDAGGQTGCIGLSINDGGSGYNVGDVITITGGTGTPANATVATVNSGAVTSLTLGQAGDYTVLPSTTACATTTNGSGVNLTVDINFEVKSIIINEGVNDFQVAPDLRVADPLQSPGGGCTPTAAVAIASMVGVVGSIILLDGGNGYSSVPTITITNHSESAPGAGATASPSIAGPVSAISVSTAGDLTYTDLVINNVVPNGGAKGSGLSINGVYETITNYDTWCDTYRQEEQRIKSTLFDVGKLYDKTEHTVDATMQLIDHPKGIISGLADTEIQYKLERDPARYNITDTDTANLASDTDEIWGEKQVGQIWWDISTVRFYNAEQGDNRYRRQFWNKLFPGSSIDIYEWTESTSLPSVYAGTGTVKDVDTYCQLDVWKDSINNFVTTYFFWVKAPSDVPNVAFRSRSANDVTNYITDPTKQGLNWYAPVSNHYEWTETINVSNTNLLQLLGQSVKPTEIVLVTINGTKVKWANGATPDVDGKISSIMLTTAPVVNDSLRVSYSRPGGALIINNIDHILTTEDSVLQLRYNTKETENNVHKQWALLRPSDVRSDIPKQFISKLIDSLTGYDATGLGVPDNTILNDIEKYGTLTRPRQTWFKNLKNARKDFVTNMNAKLITMSLDDERIAWDTDISSSLIINKNWYEIKESVTDDDGIVTNTRWTDETAICKLTIATILLRNALTESDVSTGDLVKVTNAGNNRWKIFQYMGATNWQTWKLIASENSTRELTTNVYTDDLTVAQSTELRTIINAIFNNVFTKDWAITKNEVFFDMINYVLAEQAEVDWIFKSTYATTTVSEKEIKQKDKWTVDLLPSIQDYLNEAKPYSTKIREFTGVKSLEREDTKTHTTDFDNPPYKDTLGLFGTANAVVPLMPSNEDHLPALQSGIYSDYFTNRTDATKVRALTIKMHFDRIHPTIEEPKTYISGNSAIAGVDSRPYRHTEIKNKAQRELALINSIYNATSVGESSATQIGGAVHRILKYSNKGIKGSPSTILNDIVKSRLTVDEDIASHQIILFNNMHTLTTLTYDNLNNTLDRIDTYYAGQGLTIYEAIQRYDYDVNSVLSAGYTSGLSFPEPGNASEAQNKIKLFIDRYENGIFGIREDLYAELGILNSPLQVNNEDAKLFSTADTDAVEAGEWGWDSDEWDSHEYSTTLGKEIVKRNWDDGGSFDTNYSEFRNFSSEKSRTDDRMPWHVYHVPTKAGIENINYSLNNIYVSASGIPDHAYGPFPNANNPNKVLYQNIFWKIPVTTVIPSAVEKEVTPLGPIAIARNGVAIYNPKDAASYEAEDVWHQNAVFHESEVGMDSANGHAQEAGQYHYHHNPIGMYDDNDYEHSPLLGYAFDGVPIYGPRAYPNVNGTGEIRIMRSGYRLKTGARTAIGTESVPPGDYNGKYIEDYEYVSGIGDLDKHNGRNAITPEYPGGIYAYYVTVDDLGTSVYPYIIGPTYYAKPNAENYSNTPKPEYNETFITGDNGVPNVSTDRLNRESKGFIRPQYNQYPEEYLPIAPKEGLQITTETRGVSVKITDAGATRVASAYATVQSNAITAITVTDGGAGYTSPTITIQGVKITSASPDPSGATATATVTSGVITAIDVTAGGSDFFDLPLSWRQYFDADAEKRIYALANADETTLAANIIKGQTDIQVTDVSIFDKPIADSYNRGHVVPGVIFIGTERVEYFKVDITNNKLLECRRGTGTTADQAHSTGTRIHGIKDTNTLKGKYETMWSPHSQTGLLNSAGEEARFLRSNAGNALTDDDSGGGGGGGGASTYVDTGYVDTGYVV